MPLTHSFRESVADRARTSPGFRAALIEEAMQALADGDMETARTLLREVANATLGFQALARETGILEKSLMRMLGPKGNPQARSLLPVIAHIRRRERTAA